MDVLYNWHYSYHAELNQKTTVSDSDTFKLLINVPRYTSSSLAFEMNELTISMRGSTNLLHMSRCDDSL